MYPLHQGDEIRLEDVPAEKYACSSFVEWGDPIPYRVPQGPTQADGGQLSPRIGDWYLESNRFAHYLVFDATKDEAAAVADLMMTEGLGVRRWDASYRPADNGVQYDWFIRLEFDGSHEECLRRIEDALHSEEQPIRPPGLAGQVDVDAIVAEAVNKAVRSF